MEENNMGKYNLGELSGKFGLSLSTMIRTLKKFDNLPIGENKLDKRKKYTDKTVEFLKEAGLKKKSKKKK